MSKFTLFNQTPESLFILISLFTLRFITNYFTYNRIILISVSYIWLLSISILESNVHSFHMGQDELFIVTCLIFCIRVMGLIIINVIVKKGEYTFREFAIMIFFFLIISPIFKLVMLPIFTYFMLFLFVDLNNGVICNATNNPTFNTNNHNNVTDEIFPDCTNSTLRILGIHQASRVNQCVTWYKLQANNSERRLAINFALDNVSNLNIIDKKDLSPLTVGVLMVCGFQESSQSETILRPLPTSERHRGWHLSSSGGVLTVPKGGEILNSRGLVISFLERERNKLNAPTLSNILNKD